MPHARDVRQRAEQIKMWVEGRQLSSRISRCEVASILGIAFRSLQSIFKDSLTMLDYCQIHAQNAHTVLSMCEFLATNKMTVIPYDPC